MLAHAYETEIQDPSLFVVRNSRFLIVLPPFSCFGRCITFVFDEAAKKYFSVTVNNIFLKGLNIVRILCSAAIYQKYYKCQ